MPHYQYLRCVWAHRITSPKKHIDKVYEAVVDGNISDDISGKFVSGIVLEDGMHCLPARFETIGTGKVRIVVREGKFHQVKRMFEAVGKSVIYLKREEFGGLLLDPDLEDEVPDVVDCVF